MPHCTNNFAWYLSKFIAGLTGMIFFYVVFLKEKEYSCVCRARMREYERRKGAKTNSCSLDNQEYANARKEQKTRSILAGVENVWTWYTKIRTWFQENDPAISGTALVLERDLANNNDNGNFVFPSKLLFIVGKSNVLCNVARKKPQGSTVNVRRKRHKEYRIFRHCSGLVCAEKLLKRKKTKPHSVCPHVSQDAVSEYWKICGKIDKMDVKGVKAFDQNLDAKGETEKITGNHDERKSNECGYTCKNKETQENISNWNRKSATKEIPCLSKKDSELKFIQQAPSVPIVQSCDDYNSFRSFKPAQTKFEEIKNLDKPCAYKNTSASNKSPFYETNVSDKLKKHGSLNKISGNNRVKNSLKTPINKKRSQSETSYYETLASDNCIDSILYRELCKNSTPSHRKQSSRDCSKINGRFVDSKLFRGSNVEVTKKVNACQKLNVDRVVDDLSNNVRPFSLARNQKYTLQHSPNSYRSTSRLHEKCPYHNIKSNTNSDLQKRFLPINSYTNSKYQKKDTGSVCDNCCCIAKQYNDNDAKWSNKKSHLWQLEPSIPIRSQFTTPSTKFYSQAANYSRKRSESKRKIDTICNCNFCVSQDNSKKCKPLFPDCNDQRTFVIFQNKTSSNLENSVNSSNSYSTMSTGAIEKYIYENEGINCRIPYKTSRCLTPNNGKYKYRKYDTKLDSTSLMSMSSVISLCKHCNSWSELSQNSICPNQSLISSCSCINLGRRRRHLDKNDTPISPSPNTSSSSFSTSSYSTFEDGYSAEESEKGYENAKRYLRKRTFRNKKNNGIRCLDQRRVRWNIEDI